MKVAYFCTTFPVLSETFLQREVQALISRKDLELTIFSLWKGEKQWNTIPVNTLPKWKLLNLFWLIPYEGLRNPKGLWRITKTLFSRKPTSWLNFWENLLGIGAAFLLARKIRKLNPNHLHATWASMPAATTLSLHHLLNIPFSFGAHAYDIFEHGGDWLLKTKSDKTAFIHTSTANAAYTLEDRGASTEKIKLIRRGLSEFPLFNSKRRDTDTLRIMSVGRLVEKKGYFHQLDIYQALKALKIPFEAHILGDGPLREVLAKRIKALNLTSEVKLLGSVEHKSVLEQYYWADFFLFTGIVANSGDRDGLPNVIPEAMACGVTVLTSNVAGTLEAIKNEETGIICPVETPEAWVNALQILHKNSLLNEQIREQARQWVVEHFDAHKNTDILVSQFNGSN